MPIPNDVHFGHDTPGRRFTPSAVNEGAYYRGTQQCYRQLTPESLTRSSYDSLREPNCSFIDGEDSFLLHHLTPPISESSDSSIVDRRDGHLVCAITKTLKYCADNVAAE